MIFYQNQRDHFSQNEFSSRFGQKMDLENENMTGSSFFTEIIEPDDDKEKKEKKLNMQKIRDDLISGMRVTTTSPAPYVEGVSSGESIYRVPEKVKMEGTTGKSGGGLSRLDVESEVVNDVKPVKPVKKTLMLKPKKVVKSVIQEETVQEDVDDDLSTIPTTIPLNKQYLYKTEFCRSWMESRTCKYGDKCQFAHGLSELRHVNRHPKYKTEICKAFHEGGTCPYGTRCRFVHFSPDENLKVKSTKDDAFPIPFEQYCKTNGSKLPFFRKLRNRQQSGM